LGWVSCVGTTGSPTKYSLRNRERSLQKSYLGGMKSTVHTGNKGIDMLPASSKKKRINRKISVTLYIVLNSARLLEKKENPHKYIKLMYQLLVHLLG
jgi:hypothetical protein